MKLYLYTRCGHVVWTKSRWTCNIGQTFYWNRLSIFQRNSSGKNRFPAEICAPGGWTRDCWIILSIYCSWRNKYSWIFIFILISEQGCTRGSRTGAFRLVFFGAQQLKQLSSSQTLISLSSIFSIFLSRKDFRMTSMNWSRKRKRE